MFWFEFVSIMQGMAELKNPRFLAAVTIIRIMKEIILMLINKGKGIEGISSLM